MASAPTPTTGVAPTADTVDLLVKIAGIPLTGDAAAAILDVSIDQRLNQAAQLSLRLAAWDPDTDQLTFVDDPLFSPGTSVEIELGYLDQRQPVFWGEIAGIDLEASASERAVITVHGYDILHRFGRGQRQETYKQTTYAQIVRTIGQNIYQIPVDAEDNPELDPVNPTVVQKNTSDLEFLLDLAGRIQYEVFVDAGGKTLVFRKSQLGQPSSLTLDARNDLVQLSARLDATSQLGGVEVRALDPNAKDKILVTLDNPDALDVSFGAVPTRSLITDAPLVTIEEATAHAQAELLRIRAKFITASGSCFGRADLRPGQMIELVQLGTRFDGRYHVLSTTHSLSPSGGYRTSFELEGEPR